MSVLFEAHGCRDLWMETQGIAAYSRSVIHLSQWDAVNRGFGMAHYHGHTALLGLPCTLWKGNHGEKI